MAPDGLLPADSHFQRQQEKARYGLFFRFLLKGETNLSLPTFFFFHGGAACDRQESDREPEQGEEASLSFYSNCLPPTDWSLLRTFEGGDLGTSHSLLRFFLFLNYGCMCGRVEYLQRPELGVGSLEVES